MTERELAVPCHNAYLLPMVDTHNLRFLDEVGQNIVVCEKLENYDSCFAMTEFTIQSPNLFLFLKSLFDSSGKRSTIFLQRAYSVVNNPFRCQAEYYLKQNPFMVCISTRASI